MFNSGQSSLRSWQICQCYTSSCTKSSILLIAAIALLHLWKGSVDGSVHSHRHMSSMVLRCILNYTRV
jgi:hypothetical protein